MFTDQKPFTLTEKDVKNFSNGRRFNCKLCDHDFVAGDVCRWIYANFENSPVRSGNFFICSAHAASSSVILQLAKISYEDAVKKAKQWGIYGPDWEKGWTR